LRASGFTVDRSQAYGSRIVRGGGGAIRENKECESGNKGRKRISNGEGARWQEQTGGESTRGENSEMLR
jgi:hypothetical protein